MTDLTAADLQASAAVQPEAGLRDYMVRIYSHMVAGIALTTLVSYLAASSAFLTAVSQSPLIVLVFVGPAAASLLMRYGRKNMDCKTATIVFYGLCGSFGLTLSFAAAMRTGFEVWQAFLITSGAFAALSVFGYNTGKTLSQLAAFVIFCLSGFVLAMTVAGLFGASGAELALSLALVITFGGVAAYDTKKLKEEYLEDRDVSGTEKQAIFGAMELYLDFLNLMLMLLRATAEKK